MGCDFEINIQVRYGSKWIKVLYFGTKTRCGGFPLCAATKKLYKRNSIKGDYHRYDDVSKNSNINEIFSMLGDKNNRNKVKDESIGKMKASEVQEDENTEIVDEDDAEIEEMEEEEEIRGKEVYLYYSVEQFRLLISHIENDMEAGDMYKQMMVPIPHWMTAALTAAPICEEFWMESDSTFINDVTIKIEAAQVELRDAYRQIIEEVLSNKNIPLPIVNMIADYSLPVGEDVRLAWHDDEDQTKEVINAGNPSEVREEEMNPFIQLLFLQMLRGGPAAHAGFF
jgi:hypothetical protein